MSRFPRRAIALGAFWLWVLGASACSCGGPGTTGQAAVLQSDLVEDASGKADYLIEFGVVALGDMRTRRITMRNEGSTALVLSGEKLEKPFGHDLDAAGLPIEVGAAAELAFRFEPTEATQGELETIFTLRTNEDRDRSYTIRLTGEGRRARFACEPEALDFGTVPKGNTKTLSTTCTNLLPIPVELQATQLRGNHAQFFSAKVKEASGEWLRVEGGESITIELGFRSESMGKNDAVLELVDAFNEELALVPVVAEGVESTIAFEPSTCLDFSYVGVGESATLSLSLRTIGDRPVQILRLEIPEEQRPNFSIRTPTPIELTPGGPDREILVEFHPTSSGAHQTAIGIHTSEVREEARLVTACAKGFGGGPSIRCTPEGIDFGMVAVGMPVRSRYLCVNDGASIPGLPIDPLVITAVESTSPEFSALIRNPDESEGPKRNGYDLGETFQVEVEYAPVAERFDSGSIRLETKSARGGAHETEVWGQGRVLPPCDFEVAPSRLRFGIVDKGEELRLSFGIKNHGEFACLVNGLRLADGSADAFWVEPISSVEIEAGGGLEVEVSFAPTAYAGLLEGAVEFQISHPDRMHQRVELVGTAQQPCIAVEPKNVDFGKVSPGCETRESWISISNLCSVPARLTAVSIEEGIDAGSFQIVRHPTIPRVLHPHEREELTMIFNPQALGSYSGSILVEVEGSEPYVARLLGTAEPNPVQTDVFDQEARPRVDILWVMDNSGSFFTYQERISENLPSFLTSANEQNVDFRIAVTTSGLTKVPSGSCPGGASGGEDGRFFPIDGSHPRILTPTTPDLEEHWRHNMMVGTCHGVEAYLEAAYRALSIPLIYETKSSKHEHESDYNDGNAGFLRREASLSIIFVADESDQSTSYNKEVRDYLAFFKGLKGHNMFRAHAITGARTGQSSRCRVDPGDRLLDLVDDTGGTWLDICTPVHDNAAWSEGLKKMSAGAFGFTARFFLRGTPGSRSGIPGEVVTEEDIELRIDGHPQPATTHAGQRRWTYDPISNAIDFTPLFIPKDGSQITATYRVACAP